MVALCEMTISSSFVKFVVISVCLNIGHEYLITSEGVITCT